MRIEYGVMFMIKYGMLAVLWIMNRLFKTFLRCIPIAAAYNTAGGSTSPTSCVVRQSSYIEWKHNFDDESDLIRKQLGNNLVEIHHIGSTSVEGLAAKPKIDIALVVSNFEQAKPLIELGYKYRGELNIPFRYFFSKRSEKLNTNIHVLLPGDERLQCFLMFRDILRADKDLRDRYAEFKIQNQELLSSKRNKYGLNDYNLAKNKLIMEILELSGFRGRCMSLVSHNAELDFEKSVYKTPNEDDIRIVFYKGADIVGYANASKAGKVNFFIASEDEGFFCERFNEYIKQHKSLQA